MHTLLGRCNCIIQLICRTHRTFAKGTSAVEELWGEVKTLKVHPVQASFLGRIVTENGYRMNPKATNGVEVWKYTTPHTFRDIRKLMGLLGIYCRHIKDCSFKTIYTLALSRLYPMHGNLWCTPTTTC